MVSSQLISMQSSLLWYLSFLVAGAGVTPSKLTRRPIQKLPFLATLALLGTPIKKDWTLPIFLRHL
jgi:hypothetical protein